MKIMFRLDGQAPELSVLEFEAIFNTPPKVTKDPNIYMANLDLTYDDVRSLCESSAMIKKAWTDDIKIWKSYSPQYPGREPKDKPGFHPAMLKPKWARLLINLARMKRSSRLLDPFCGTGSVLIEAYYLDLKPTGIDLDSRAIEKSRKNLNHYGLPIKAKIGDATTLEKYFKQNYFDGIVTDLPYGRSSTLAGKEIQDLYYNFLVSALKVLKQGAYLVMMKPSTVPDKIPKGFKKISCGGLYAHRGLTRRAVVLQKK